MRTYADQTNSSGSDLPARLTGKTSGEIESFNSSVDVPSPLTIPVGVRLKPRGGAYYTKSGTGKLLFLDEGVNCRERRKIFYNFSPGEIQFYGKYPIIYPEWFGMVANNASAGAANDAAYDLMMESFQSQGLSGHLFMGGTIHWANGIYYWGSAKHIDLKSTFRGVNGTKFYFPANTKGLQINAGATMGNNAPFDRGIYFSSLASNSLYTANHYPTITLATPIPAEYVGGEFQYSGGTLTTPISGQITNISGDGLTVTVYANTRLDTSRFDGTAISAANPLLAATGVTFKAHKPRSAADTVIDNIECVSAGGSATHTLSITGLVVTRNSGDAFDYWQGFKEGKTITIDGIHYMIDSRNVIGTGGASFPFKNADGSENSDAAAGFTATFTRTSANHYTVSGATINNNWRYAIITKSGVDYYLTGINIAENKVVLSGDIATGTATVKFVTDTDKLTLSAYRVAARKGAPDSMWFHPDYPVSSKWAGATIRILGTATTYTIDTIDAPNKTAVVTGMPDTNNAYVEWEIISLASGQFTSVSARVNRFPGIDLKTMATLQNCTVIGFPGEGICIDSQNEPTNTGIGSQPNQNNSKIMFAKCYSNSGAGIYTLGVNANNISFFLPDLQGNGISLFEACQHPNSWFSAHVSNNNQEMVIRQTLQGSSFWHIYLEADVLKINASPQTQFHGGTYPFGTTGGLEFFFNSKSAGWITNSALKSYVRKINTGGGTSGMVDLGFQMVGAFKNFFKFGQIDSEKRFIKYYTWMYETQGWYELFYFDSHEEDGFPEFSPTNPAVSLSTSQAPMGGGFYVFKKGAYFQSPDGTYWKLTVSDAGVAVFTELVE